MSTTGKSLGERMTAFPAAGIAYGMAAAFVLGLGCGLLNAPFAAVAIIGLACAALALRLEWKTLTAGPDGGRRANIGLQLIAAAAFLVVVGVGVTSLADFLIHAALKR